MLERLWKCGDVRCLVVGHPEQGGLQAITRGAADEHQPPRLAPGSVPVTMIRS
jgi:hypothetical protein